MFIFKNNVKVMNPQNHEVTKRTLTSRDDFGNIAKKIILMWV
jgi:hypothetical protein